MPEFLAICNIEPGAVFPLDPNDLFVAVDDPRDRRLGRLRIIVSHARASETAVWEPEAGPSYVGWAALTNGESLRRRLRTAGWRAPLAGDIATIAAVWEMFGEAGLRLLRGPFAAIGLWPSGEVRAFRDHLGLCPLYYSVSGRQFAFSSAVRPLTTVPWFDRRVDETSLAHSIVGTWGVQGRTVWSTVRRVPGGHMLHAPAKLEKITSYWDPVAQAQPLDKSLGLEEHASEVGRLLDQAISRTLGAGRTAVAFSGGFDSTTVAALAARRTSQSVLAATWDFDDEGERYDDLPYAKAAAEELGLQWLPITAQVDPASGLSSSGRRMDLAWRFHLPSERSAAERVRELGAARMLTGESGDAVLLGRRWAALATLIWDRKLRRAVRYAGGAASFPMALRQLAGHNPTVRRLSARRRPQTGAEILTQELRESAGLRHGSTPVGGVTPTGLRREREHGIRDVLAERLRELDFQLGLEVGIAMAQPLADVDLVEYALRVPDTYFVGPPSDRRLHTVALGNRLPEAVRTRPTKAEFSGLAMRFVEDQAPQSLIASSRLVDMGLVDRARATQTLADARRQVASGRSGGLSLWQVTGFVEAETFLRAIALEG